MRRAEDAQSRQDLETLYAMLDDEELDDLSAYLPGTAEVLLTPGQRGVLLGTASTLVVGLVLVPQVLAPVLVSLATALYLVVLLHRTQLFRRGAEGTARGTALWQVTDEEARAVRPEDLPLYTVLIPAYGEPEVVGQVLANVAALDYPPDRLDVRLLLESDDTATREAAARSVPGSGVTVVVVPPLGPRTKPKACNVGLDGARGDLVTIYDAEDHPEPLQLRRAAVAFSRAPSDVACLQARLSYHNVHHNQITRWFTNEYDVWFRYYLPGLVASGSPVPLGGTSNHLKREVLDELGGWDAHNVTEDADLGIRLHRRGWRTGILDSVTEEEANSDFINWVRQRSRWYKGYLATWLVHVRSPRALVEQIGWRAFVGFNLFVAGTPVLAALNPVFWSLSLVWLVFGASAVDGLFPPVIYHLSLLSWVLGGFLVVYSAVYAARDTGRPELLPSLVVLPLYWLMMSIAAVKAVVQLVVDPAYWEKTVHGLTAPSAGAPVVPR